MEREVGGGIGMGNTCKPMAVSLQCMTKSTTNKQQQQQQQRKAAVQCLTDSKAEHSRRTGAQG